MPTERVKAASLVLDFNLYPRLKLSEHNISQLRDARAVGADIPPIVAAAHVGASKSRDGRVADGFHRVTDVLREDPEGEIDVEWRDYETEADLFEDAVRLNAGHGHKLTKVDQTRIVHLGEGLGLTLERLSSALSVPVDALERRGANIAVIAAPSRRQVRGQEIVPLKRTYSNLKGKTITAKQVEANSSATGHPQSFLFRQVILIVESGAIDWDTPLVVQRARELRDLLNELDIPEEED